MAASWGKLWSPELAQLVAAAAAAIEHLPCWPRHRPLSPGLAAPTAAGATGFCPHWALRRRHEQAMPASVLASALPPALESWTSASGGKPVPVPALPREDWTVASWEKAL